MHRLPELRMQKQILNYFLRNPLAADTLEGVARWRLLDEVVRSSVEETNIALQWLVGEGFLSKSASAGAGTTFRLNPARTTQARQFLHGAPTGEAPGETADSDHRPTANRRDLPA